MIELTNSRQWSVLLLTSFSLYILTGLTDVCRRRKGHHCRRPGHHVDHYTSAGRARRYSIESELSTPLRVYKQELTIKEL